MRSDERAGMSHNFVPRIGMINTITDPVIVCGCSSTILKTPESITMDINEQIMETPLVSESDSPIDDRDEGPTDGES